LRELKGFQRVDLKVGESKTIVLPLPEEVLKYWHPIKDCWVLPEGPISVEVGFSERDIKLQQTLPAIQTSTQSPIPSNIKNH